MSMMRGLLMIWGLGVVGGVLNGVNLVAYGLVTKTRPDVWVFVICTAAAILEIILLLLWYDRSQRVKSSTSNDDTARTSELADAERDTAA